MMKLLFSESPDSAGSIKIISLSARVKNDSGVNLDEELANMILFQNAFNASARIVAATRDMFDELLSIAR